MTEINGIIYVLEDFPRKERPKVQACLSNIPKIKTITCLKRIRKGSYSGAAVWQVGLRLRSTRKDRTGILKIAQTETTSREYENYSKATGSINHPPIPELISCGNPQEGWQAMVFAVAQQRFLEAQTLGDCLKVEGGGKALKQLLQSLEKWYGKNFQRSVNGFEFLKLPHMNDLRYNPQLFEALKGFPHVQAIEKQLLFQGEKDAKLLPNPLHFACHPGSFADYKLLAPFGHTHGDLHVYNVIVSKDENPSPMLIDLDYYTEEGSILHDLAYLEISVSLNSLSSTLRNNHELFEQLYRTPWFRDNPVGLDLLPASILHLIREIRNCVINLSGKINLGIQEQYTTAYVHAVASSALRWLGFKVSSGTRMAALYIAAKALEQLRQHNLIIADGNHATIEWRQDKPIDIRTTNPLSVIYRTIEKDRIRITRIISGLNYPFLRTLSRLGSTKWKEEIEAVDALCRQSFFPGESIVSIDALKKWQTASPKSWLICKMNNLIVGYVHVEPLSSIRGNAILRGLSNEGEIQPDDILNPKKLKDDDYIHIGSIVSKYFLYTKVVNQTVQQQVAVQLVAGIVDRILDLWSPDGNGAHKVLAVDYPDANRDHHATNLFKNCGFEHEKEWHTNEGDPVYILDLNKPLKPALQELLDSVKDVREKYR